MSGYQTSGHRTLPDHVVALRARVGRREIALDAAVDDLVAHWDLTRVGALDLLDPEQFTASAP